MKVPFLIIIVLLFGTASLSQVAVEKHVKDEVLVKLAKSSTSFGYLQSLGSRLRSEPIEKLGDSGWYKIKLNPGSNLQNAVAELSENVNVVGAQPNYYYRLQAIPNDPAWGGPGTYGLPKISAPAAWDLTTGSSTVVVANIDTGMLYTHEDLAPNMWTNPGEINGNGIDDDGNGFADDYYGYDFFFNDPDPRDEHWHGTHTGGTIGAAGNNALGFVGVAWNVRIMAIKIYDNDSRGTTTAMLVNAYNYIRLMKERGVNIRVTNNSYGGCDEACAPDPATEEAINAMGDAGILNVFAAGNNGRNVDSVPFFPASYTSPSIVSVAASTEQDTKASFSNWGANGVDIAAPGSGIWSTISFPPYYGGSSGTSMAAPHVSGAAALLASYHPTLTVSSLKATLMNTGDPLSGWETTPTKTNRRLNIFNALNNPTVCHFDLSSTDIKVGTKGGYYYLDVAAPANCDFPVKSNVKWIKVDTAVVSGTRQITVRISVNPTISRTGTITVAGQTVSFTQSRGQSLN